MNETLNNSKMAALPHRQSVMELSDNVIIDGGLISKSFLVYHAIQKSTKNSELTSYRRCLASYVQRAVVPDD